MHSKTKSFVTVASGKKYLSFAFTLARSYKLHNDLIIPFYIISDKDFHLPNDLDWVKKKILPKEVMGQGLEYKLRFNEVISTDQAFFIDADSVIYGNIAHLFDAFASENLNVIGIKVKEGNWADLDSKLIFEKYKISYIIRYCGAFYYITKSDLSSDIFKYAQELAKNKQTFQQHVHGVNDEPIMSISMAAYGIDPLPDDGHIWSDTHQLNTHKDLNVFNKRPVFNNKKDQAKYKFWLPEGQYSPLILHMGGAIYNKNPWIFESIRLKLLYKLKLSMETANLLVDSIIIPGYFTLKKINRLFEKSN